MAVVRLTVKSIPNSDLRIVSKERDYLRDPGLEGRIII
jgi:hypothetical protein